MVRSFACKAPQIRNERGGMVLRSKFAKILAAVAVFLAVFYSVIAVMGAVTPGQHIVGAIASPFRWALSSVGEAIGGIGDYFTEFKALKKENEELARRVSELEVKAAHVEDLEGENAWMREFLGVKDELEDYEMINAHVIGRESNSYMTLYLINKGSAQGIKRDMAVLSGGSVVGRVESVGLNWCKVTTILENASSVGAMCARSGARGVVDGSLGLRGEGRCSMNYINEFADIKVGDKIISSGEGSVYPYGFSIGTVEEIRLDENNRSVSAIIKPDVDLDSVTRVMIVKRK